MTQTTNEILTLTTIEAELFQHDDGEFPHIITLVTMAHIEDIVAHTINNMMELFKEYSEYVTVSHKYAKFLGSEDENDDITLTPATLVLLLSYSKDRQRIIILELADSKEHFSVH